MNKLQRSNLWTWEDNLAMARKNGQARRVQFLEAKIARQEQQIKDQDQVQLTRSLADATLAAEGQVTQEGDL